MIQLQVIQRQVETEVMWLRLIEFCTSKKSVIPMILLFKWPLFRSSLYFLMFNTICLPLHYTFVKFPSPQLGMWSFQEEAPHPFQVQWRPHLLLSNQDSSPDPEHRFQHPDLSHSACRASELLKYFVVALLWAMSHHFLWDVSCRRRFQFVASYQVTHSTAMPLLFGLCCKLLPHKGVPRSSE